MHDNIYTVDTFVADLRAIAAAEEDARQILQRLRPLVLKLAAAPGWLQDHHYDCDPKEGYGSHLLHEEADHSLAVMAGSWLPGFGVPPHDHGTWAIVAGVDGVETNVNWERLDDGAQPGFAEVAARHEVGVGPGTAVAFLADDIHSVRNDSAKVSVSLHVYGMHPNYTERLQFDPETGKTDLYRFQE